MKLINEILELADCAQDPQSNYLFNDRKDEDRTDEDSEKENEPATMDDWGDVDPASGPAPSAPGSAV